MKLKSRKFWICVASVLASIGTSIAGLCVSEKWIAVVGIICTVISSAIYAGCEAYVDAQRVGVEDKSAEIEVAIDDVRVDSDDDFDDVK